MSELYEKSLHKLELDQVLIQLASCAGSEGGKQACLNLRPSSDLEDVQAMLDETTAASELCTRKGNPSFSDVKDVSASLERADRGGSLQPAELLGVAGVLRCARNVKGYVSEDEKATVLDPLFKALSPNKFLEDRIFGAILSEEEIADNASPALADIRRHMRVQSAKIRDSLQKVISSPAYSKYLREPIITIRQGRYVVPVKSECKNDVPGLVHDVSATGSTYFVEPMSAVNANNALRELELKEKKEIERILAELSSEVAAHRGDIEENIVMLTRLDVIFAKARLAYHMKAWAPLMNDQGKVELRNARHPLIDPKKVVPISLRLGTDFDTMIITGPNTGGKTVSLKTVGLLTLMGQAGLHIPAGDRSELAIFHEVFADIGDEQSIEQSLSTFSSHMTNIVRILEKANDRCLCLFDELCAGTDPTEGAALAIAILHKLHQYGATTMATTHYSELKVYALSTKGVENACCEFNVETLSPTYRLLIGIPGKSNAFAISSKLGLAENIIEDARARLSDKDADFEDLLANLEHSRQTIEKEQLEINQYKSEIEALKAKLETKQERLDASREDILRQANEEAYRILKEAKDVADETIRNFNKYGQAQAPMSQMEKERSKVRDKMSEKEKKLSMKAPKQENHKVPKKLRIGDSVKVLSMNLKGTVHTLPNAKGDLYVQMGILRSLVNIKDLVLIDEDTSPATKKYSGSGSGKIKMSKSASVSTEINLIGLTVDEAIARLDKYLDDAYLAHLPSVRIVHGKGTGALRNGVQAHLKSLKYVKSYRLGEAGEGGAGVTIAVLD